MNREIKYNLNKCFDGCEHCQINEDNGHEECFHPDAPIYDTYVFFEEQEHPEWCPLRNPNNE